jgi:hypothetical protein
MLSFIHLASCSLERNEAIFFSLRDDCSSMLRCNTTVDRCNHIMVLQPS